MCPGRRLTKIQATTRLDNVWPESWSDMPKAARKEMQERAIGKPKIDNARGARGICSVDPEDMASTEKPSKREATLGDSYGGGNALQNGHKEAP